MCTFTTRYRLQERKRATTFARRAITIWEAIQKRSYEPIYKINTKIEAKGLRAITKWGAIVKIPILLSQYRNLYNKLL